MENIEDPVSTVITNDKQKTLVNDTRILRARGGDQNDPDASKRPTDPVGLSRSILHVLREHEYVRILSVGPTALSSIMAAFRLASREVESLTNGSVLVCRQSEYNAEIAGKKTKGISTRIFAIDIKFAL
jgi:stage V sporulation protein SpoVS